MYPTLKVIYGDLISIINEPQQLLFYLCNNAHLLKILPEK